MGEVMSQDEIDRLLNALSNGDFDPEQMEDPNEKQVKVLRSECWLHGIRELRTKRYR